MGKKTVLLVDDEQVFLEALEDALLFEGYNVLKATSAEEALELLEKEKIDLITVDIMMPAGESLESETSNQETGVFLCKEIVKRYPKLDVFCISVVSNPDVIKAITEEGVRFLRKGETPLKTVINMIRSRLSGVAYSTNTH